MSDTVDRILKLIRDAGYDRKGEAVANDTLTAALHDADADSLDAIDILFELEEEFSVELEDNQIAARLCDLAKAIDAKLAAMPVRGMA